MHSSGNTPLDPSPSLVKCDLSGRYTLEQRIFHNKFFAVHQIVNNINQGVKMGFVSGLLKVAAGAAAGVAAVTALPIFGVAGTITATGIVVGSTLGAAAGITDEIKNKDKKQ